jgi:hypothetical protein
VKTIPQSDSVANLPVAELEAAMEQFLKPDTERMPDKRLARVMRLAVQGFVTANLLSLPSRRAGWPARRHEQAVLSLHRQHTDQSSRLVERDV